MDREPVDGEALARTLVQDPPFATRLQLSQKYQEVVPGLLPETVASVKAMPVYGTEERFDSATEELRDSVPEQSMLQVVCKSLPTPVSDAPLSDIVSLREKPQFQKSMYKLREWQMQVVPQLLQEKPGTNRERLIRKAARDFEEWIEQYDDAMRDATFRKVQITTVSVLAVGAALASGATPLLTVLSGLAGPLLDLRQLTKPSWKAVANEEFAPAGVIYAAARM